MTITPTVREALQQTNWPLLRDQKLTLLSAIQDAEDGSDKQATERLTGLLNWIDAIQDAAHAEGYPVEFLTEEEDGIPNAGRYPLTDALLFPWKASRREENLGSSDLKRGHRVIGGDKGDLIFTGYDVTDDGTQLRDPILVSSLQLTEEEAHEIAVAIVEEAYASVGTECVERS